MGETSVTASVAGSSESGDGDGVEALGPSTDGRVSRAARTRAAVVDALLALNERGELRPTARDIATEAGVSLRSLYVHFDDLESLFVESSRRHNERLVASLPPIVADGSFADRLDAFLDRRVQVHEFAPGVRRAALLQEPFSPVLQKVLAQGRKALRAEVATSFGPELAAVDGDEMPLLRALDVATCGQAWETLRMQQGLSVEAATAQLRAMVLAFVRAWVPDTEMPDPAGVPVPGAADRGAPDLATPDPEEPDHDEPGLDVPDLATPDHATPDHGEPGLDAPDLAAPDPAEPDHDDPDLDDPDLDVPDPTAHRP